MTWQRVMLGLLALCMLGCVRASPERHVPRTGQLDAALWEGYRARFVAGGRVIDVDNGGITHSEGQGYGMLFAVAADDRRTFDEILRWTLTTLRRPDGLFSWHFGPCPTGGEDCVTDPNNASDGDLLIAWALVRAADRWGLDTYREQAGVIARALATGQVVRRHGRLVLLPGMQGFDAIEPDGMVTLNPSYWIFPALEQLAAVFPDGPWKDLGRSGRELIAEARFGNARLVPDWLDLSATGLAPSIRFKPQHGYNAVRVPLHLAWSSLGGVDLLAPYLSWWASFVDRNPPAWIDLVDGSTSDYPWSSGMAAIAQVVRVRAGVDKASPLPLPTADDGYYSSSLILLARLALVEMPQ